MRYQVRHILTSGGLPFTIVSALFYGTLRERSDYLGHYAAGYGGTLCASVVLLALITRASVMARAYALFAVRLLCIAAGAVAEATVFRLAQFDPIDFFNQSLGAIMAGLVAIGMARAETVSDSAMRTAAALGVVAMLAGVYFAFA